LIRKGVLKSFDSGTYKATVQIIGSLSVWLADVPTNRGIAPGEMLADRYCAVLTPDPGQPGDSVVIAVWT
jgi:hypothetical protein